MPLVVACHLNCNPTFRYHHFKKKLVSGAPDPNQQNNCQLRDFRQNWGRDKPKRSNHSSPYFINYVKSWMIQAEGFTTGKADGALKPCVSSFQVFQHWRDNRRCTVPHSSSFQRSREETEHLVRSTWPGCEGQHAADRETETVSVRLLWNWKGFSEIIMKLKRFQWDDYETQSWVT